MTEKREKAIIAANRYFSLMSFLSLLQKLISAENKSSFKNTEKMLAMFERKFNIDSFGNLSVSRSVGRVLRSLDEGAKRKTK